MVVHQCEGCKSKDIDYGDCKVEEEMVYFEYWCYNCQNEGKEWYSIEYVMSE